MKKHLLLFVVVLHCLPVWGQLFPELTFQKFFDNHGEDFPRKILKTSDKGLLIGGTTWIEDKGSPYCSNVWIIKTDSMGELLWDREIDVEGCEELRDIEIADDGGVLFVGVTNALIEHAERGDEEFYGDYFVGKIDSLGEVEWLQGMGGSSLDQAYGISQGLYREYMIAGGSHSNDGAVGANYGMSDIWLLKIDNNGKTRHSQVLGGPRNDWATALITCQNGDYLLSGFTNSSSLGEKNLGMYGNALLVRLNQSGQVLWRQTFSCPQGGFFTDLTENRRGDLFLAGAYETGKQGREFWWMILNAAGELIDEWVLDGSGDEQLNAIASCNDGGVVLGGHSRSETKDAYIKGGDDFWVMRTNGKGRLIWKNTYGGPDNERCMDVIEYRPGVFYAIGQKHNNFSDEDSRRGTDFWLIRVEEHPCSEIQPGIFVRAKDFKVYRDKPVRFRARYQHGDRFFWDFGDGTTSTEEQPLKTFKLPGLYEVTLTVFANESCEQSIKLEQALEVW